MEGKGDLEGLTRAPWAALVTSQLLGPNGRQGWLGRWRLERLNQAARQPLRL